MKQQTIQYILRYLEYLVDQNIKRNAFYVEDLLHKIYIPSKSIHLKGTFEYQIIQNPSHTFKRGHGIAFVRKYQNVPPDLDFFEWLKSVDETKIEDLKNIP